MSDRDTDLLIDLIRGVISVEEVTVILAREVGDEIG